MEAVGQVRLYSTGRFCFNARDCQPLRTPNAQQPEPFESQLSYPALLLHAAHGTFRTWALSYALLSTVCPMSIPVQLHLRPKLPDALRGGGDALWTDAGKGWLS